MTGILNTAGRVGISASKATHQLVHSPGTEPGHYYIRHYGNAKNFWTQKISEIERIDLLFEVLGTTP